MSDIKVAIKGTLQGDGSLLPANKANKGVMVVKTDGTNAGEPYGYLTKENLAQIVREELASILNGDSVSTLAKLVGLDSSANMKSITAANLASVLGGVFGVKYGEIPADTDVQITLGTGLFVCTMFSTGAVVWLTYWQQPENMTSTFSAPVSITKVGESGNTYTIRANGISLDYFFIGSSRQ